MKIKLLVTDMAGTTVSDDGIVLKCFNASLKDAKIDPESDQGLKAIQYVKDTMGLSKIVVFRHIFKNEKAAEQANQVFEQTYSKQVEEHGVEEIPGARKALEALIDNGIKIAFTTGFSSATQKAILDSLKWKDLTDVVLCPNDQLRGRPYPDMVWEAAIRQKIDDIKQVAVVGDTSNDIESGLKSGSINVFGVLTGAHSKAQLEAANPHAIYPSIVELVEKLA